MCGKLLIHKKHDVRHIYVCDAHLINRSVKTFSEIFYFVTCTFTFVFGFAMDSLKAFFKLKCKIRLSSTDNILKTPNLKIHYF